MDAEPEQPHKRTSTRLPGYDYTQAGAYFVTIVSHNRTQIFGEISENQIHLSPIGNIVRDCWCEIPSHFSNTILDEFVIMPNHVHGIIIITESSVGVHNPGHADHEFRRMPITDSVLCRSVIPAMPIRSPGKKWEQMAG